MKVPAIDHSAGPPTLAGTVRCQVQTCFTGASICEVDLFQDNTGYNLKCLIGSIVHQPPELLQLIVDEEVVSDRAYPLSGVLGCCRESICIGLSRLPIQASCHTPEEMCKTLSALTCLGPQAVLPRVSEVVSILQQPLESPPSSFRGRNARVHVAACFALEAVGADCSNLATELAVALSTLMNDEEVESTVDHLLQYHSSDNFDNFLFQSRCGSDSPSFLPTAFSNVFASMGLDSVGKIMRDFSASFQSSAASHKALLLLTMTRTISLCNEEVDDKATVDEHKKIDASAPFVPWFAAFLKEPDEVLCLCALRCLLKIVKSFNVHTAEEPHIHDMLGLLRHRKPAQGNLFLDVGSCVRRAVGELLASLDGVIASHAEEIVSMFLACVGEDTARSNLAHFQSFVEKKSHGAYMSYMKADRYGDLATFSNVFGALGYAGVAALMRDFPEIAKNAGPCQRAALLLCAARALPTFAKPIAATCTSWFSSLLSSPHWQLRMCAIVCLQRSLAGNMVRHMDAIAALLSDEVPFVRQSATIALSCLGRSAMRYDRQLLALLDDSSHHVRYASLVALGGLLAGARPHRHSIAEHLTDDDPKCRMAALRALKCIGETAEPYVDQLERWQSKWFHQVPREDAGKPEPITTRALLFPSIPLKDLFRGHAPLGHRFAGSKATQQARTVMLNSSLRKTICRAAEEPELSDEEMVSLDAVKEARSDDIATQAHYRAVDAERRLQRRERTTCQRRGKQEEADSRKFGAYSRSLRARRAKRARTSSAEAVEDWPIPNQTLAEKVAIHI